MKQKETTRFMTKNVSSNKEVGKLKISFEKHKIQV